jgi:hypothetical protein
MSWIEDGWPAAGLYVGALCWMASTQVNYMLPAVVCAQQSSWVVPLLSFGLALITTIAGFFSWRALAGRNSRPDPHAGGRPHRFMAIIGMSSAALFAAVILLQGAAGLVLHGCER